jgi:hypothetical protein
MAKLGKSKARFWLWELLKQAFYTVSLSNESLDIS